MFCLLNSFVASSSFVWKSLRPATSYHNFYRATISREPIGLLKNCFSTNESPNSRFWIKLFDLPKLENESDPASYVDYVKDMLSSKMIEIPKSENAVLFIPKAQLLVPLYNSVLQSQHAIQLEGMAPNDRNSSKLILCGFFPRAQMINLTPEEAARPIDSQRLKAINFALSKLTDITGDQLLEEQFIGSPPARIYRSFISPRMNGVYKKEPIEKTAQAVAQQIDFALRQLRADEAATIIRNTDNSLQSKANPHTITLVLDNVRSAFNVGSLFRTAETANIQELLTCGITAHPPNPKLKKTALTSLELVPTRHFADTLAAVQQLKSEGWKIVALETTSISKKYTEVEFPKEKIAIVVGNELTGIDPRILEAADMVVEIPVYGVKNSLNVVSASSIMLFELIRQWNS
jgi:23S rRNA (guanosine2251-2'-O)-methyltransferase